MPNVFIPNDTFQRLVEQAAVRHISVAELVAPLLDKLVGQGGPAEPLSPAESARQFEAWMAQVKGRATRYPAGFVVDDSRESFYQGREE